MTVLFRAILGLTVLTLEQAKTDAFNVIAIETRTAELKQTPEEGRASVCPLHLNDIP